MCEFSGFSWREVGAFSIKKRSVKLQFVVTDYFEVSRGHKKRTSELTQVLEFKWWRHRELNLEPRGYESRALTD